MHKAAHLTVPRYVHEGSQKQDIQMYNFEHAHNMCMYEHLNASLTRHLRKKVASKKSLPQRLYV